MPWIEWVDREQATGKLDELYSSFPGPIDHVVKIHSLIPEAMDALLLFYRTVLHGQQLELTMTERETIAVAVSAVNDCHY